MGPKKRQASQVGKISKRARKCNQCSQQILPENHVIWAVENLCDRLCRLEHRLQDHATDGAGSSVGDTNPVMTLLYDISQQLAAIKEKDGPQWDNPMPSSSVVPILAMVPYMPYQLWTWLCLLHLQPI